MRHIVFSVLATLTLVSCGGGGGSGGSTTAPTAPPATPANRPPQVALANTNQTAEVGVSFSYDAAQNDATFSDPDGDSLSLALSLSDTSLGLTANGTDILGTPTTRGTIEVTVTASDPGGLSVSDVFSITINDPTQANSPNILLIIADDLGQDSSAQYSLSSDLPNTPTLNSLAANGVVFNNLWVNPVCSPTRASLLTGKYGVRTGVLDAGDNIPTTETVLHRFLKDSPESGNYASSLIGKWHLGNRASSPLNMGIDHFAGLLSGGVDDYFDWTLNVNGENRQVTTYATTEITNQAITWVEDRSGPWFMMVSYNAPHTPFHAPPSNLHSRNLSGTPTDIQTNSRDYYLAAIEAMDTEMGRMLNALSTSERANTVVMFIGDNGSPGRVVDTSVFPSGAKGTVYEGGVRVPMIVSGAAVTRINQREDALINGVDFFATISELAGQTQPTIHDSISFLPLLSDESASSRAFIFAESAGAKSVRDDRYKLIENADGTREFFDLLADPMELNTVFGTPAYEEPITELEGALQQILEGGQWLVNTSDTRSAYLMDGGEFVEVNVQSVVNNGVTVDVTTNTIPNYRIQVTDEVLNVINNRSGTSGIDLSVGDVIDWGEDIGFNSTCPNTGGDGWWPPGGASCPTAQDGVTYSIPADPTPSQAECETGLGPVGIWLNGVPIFNWSDASSFQNDGIWNQVASEFRRNSLDLCNGHSGNGTYHHHSYNACLRQTVGDRGDGHSPIYGYAGDGYPIHGPYHATGQRVESCWIKRDYAASSETGCGDDGARTCRFIDEENVPAGVQTVAAGPSTNDTVTIGGEQVPAAPGFYYEDYYYDAACTVQGDRYLDEHNGHDHDSLGYHYHTTVDDALNPTFPLVHGPDYFGNPSDGSFRCFRDPL